MGDVHIFFWLKSHFSSRKAVVLAKVHHGSWNVPMFHITQPWSVYGLLDGYFTLRWCPIFPSHGTVTPTPEKHHRKTNPKPTAVHGSGRAAAGAACAACGCRGRRPRPGGWARQDGGAAGGGDHQDGGWDMEKWLVVLDGFGRVKIFGETLSGLYHLYLSESIRIYQNLSESISIS